MILLCIPERSPERSSRRPPRTCLARVNSRAMGTYTLETRQNPCWRMATNYPDLSTPTARRRCGGTIDRLAQITDDFKDIFPRKGIFPASNSGMRYSIECPCIQSPSKFRAVTGWTMTLRDRSRIASLRCAPVVGFNSSPNVIAPEFNSCVGSVGKKISSCKKS